MAEPGPVGSVARATSAGRRPRGRQDLKLQMAPKAPNAPAGAVDRDVRTAAQSTGGDGDRQPPWDISTNGPDYNRSRKSRGSAGHPNRLRRCNRPGSAGRRRRPKSDRSTEPPRVASFATA